jgi:hypothetical protein
VLDAAGDDEQVSRAQLDVAGAELDRQLPAEDQEGFLLVLVDVPGGRPDALGHLEQVAVRAADDLLRPELGQPLGHVGGGHLLHLDLQGVVEQFSPAPHEA